MVDLQLLAPLFAAGPQGRILVAEYVHFKIPGFDCIRGRIEEDAGADHSKAGWLPARKKSHAIELSKCGRIAENDGREVRHRWITKQACRNSFGAEQFIDNRSNRSASVRTHFDLCMDTIQVRRQSFSAPDR